MKHSIFVKFTVPGFHYWVDAPEGRKYLSNNHRHLFHVDIRTHVDHDDREIEFHDLMDYAKLHFAGGEMGGMSCEMMATQLGVKLAKRFKRTFLVEVSEDGECGASIIIEYRGDDEHNQED